MTKPHPTQTGHLHLLCGKISAGKSTMATKLAASEGAIIISEDEWLGKLFKEELKSLEDYVRCSGKLKTAMEPHLIRLLQAGQSLILDFPANTKKQRAWMKTLIEKAACDHSLHFLATPDDVCIARLHKRNAEGCHDFQATEDQFHQFSSFFVSPQPEEGFAVITHSADE